MKIKWKDGLISLGIIGVVVGGSAYLNYINTHTTYDTAKVTANAAQTTDDNQDITVAPYDGNNDSPIVDDSYMNTPVEQSDAPKQDPQIGDTISDVDNSTWGRAGDVTTTKTAYGESQFWIYQNGRSILFDNGKVVSITQ